MASLGIRPKFCPKERPRALTIWLEDQFRLVYVSKIMAIANLGRVKNSSGNQRRV